MCDCEMETLTYRLRCELCTSSESVLASAFGPSIAIEFHFGASEECFVASLDIAIKHVEAKPFHSLKLTRSLCMLARSNAERIGVSGLSLNASFLLLLRSMLMVRVSRK